MIPSKYLGRIVLLSIVALMLAVCSLMLPWYKVDHSWTTIDGPHQSEYTFYIYGWSTDGNPSVNRYAFASWQGDLGMVMGSQTVLVWIWFFALLVFLGFLFGGTPGILPGLVLLGVGYSAIAYFAMKMPDVVGTSDPFMYLMPEGNLKFVGSYQELDSEWSYGPMSGWWVMVMASAVQTVAVVLRILATLVWPVEPQVEDEEPELIEG